MAFRNMEKNPIENRMDHRRAIFGIGYHTVQTLDDVYRI